MKIYYLFPGFLLIIIFLKYSVIGSQSGIFKVFSTPETELKLNNPGNDREVQLLRQNMQTGRLIMMFSIVTAGGLTMFLSLLYIDIRRKKSMLAQQKTLAEAEASLLKERLESTNKELTSQALLLAALSDTRNQFSRVVEEIMPHVNENGRKIIQSALQEYEFKVENDAWKEFERHFNQVNESFYASLNNRHPDLTGFEKRLCALIKLNLNTKDISMIQNKSVRGVESARYRLKKRLGLRENENLYEYLNSI